MVAPGSSTTLSARVRPGAAVSGAIVDFEVDNSANTGVYQGFHTVSLAANASQTLVSSWAVPGSRAAGGYVLKIGIFGPNWSPTFAWDNSAAGITVS